MRRALGAGASMLPLVSAAPPAPAFEAGQWQTVSEIVDIEVPAIGWAMTREETAELRDQMRAEQAITSDVCLDAHGAIDGRPLLDQAGKQCVFAHHAVTGGRIATEGTCTVEDGTRRIWRRKDAIRPRRSS